MKHSFTSLITKKMSFTEEITYEEIKFHVRNPGKQDHK